MQPPRTFYIFSSQSGQSLIEILIAVGVGVILITAAASVIAPALRVNSQATNLQIGAILGRELLENVRVWTEGDWHGIAALATSTNNRYYLNASSSPYTLRVGTESVMVGTSTYTRSFSVDDVYRDGGDFIITSGGSYDPSTKLVTVQYNWLQGTTGTMQMYVTRSRSTILNQTDWSGGSGQDGPITTPNALFASSTQIDNTTTSGSIVIKFN